MIRRAWLLLALAVPACNRPATPEEASARIVGTWKVVRENGKAVQLRDGRSGLVRYHADGTVTQDEAPRAGGSVKNTTVVTYRFLDAETVEATETGARVKTTTFRAVISGDRLTLHKPDDPDRTAEFERVK